MENETPEIPPLIKEELKDINDSKRTQLSFLQTRISLHGNRMWQLPLTYIGSLALAISAADSERLPFPKWWIFFVVTAFGFALLWCISGAYEGYKRTAMDMCRIEGELGLIATTRNAKSHSIPYFLLIILGMLFSIVAAGSIYPG